MSDKYRITRAGYLPVGYEVHQPELPIDTYVAPPIEKGPFIPSGYQNGRVRFSEVVLTKSQRRPPQAIAGKTSKLNLGRTVFWILMALLAAPFVLWWALIKLAKPGSK